MLTQTDIVDINALRHYFEQLPEQARQLGSRNVKGPCTPPHLSPPLQTIAIKSQETF
jgi:hypothetical protein